MAEFMSSEGDLVVSFRINGKIHDIEISQGENENELYTYLLDDNSYTLDYLNSLVNSGVICLDGKLSEIYRISPDGELEDKIYPVEYKSITENKDKWNSPETTLLLEKYELYITQVGQCKVFRNKKAMWEQIAHDINAAMLLKKTAVQVENRFKTLLRRKEYEARYKQNQKEDDSFQEKLNVLLFERPPKRNCRKTDALCDSSSTKNEKTLHEVLQKIHSEKEAGKERRHKEKLMLLRKQEIDKERRHREKLEMFRELLKAKVVSDVHLNM